MRSARAAVAALTIFAATAPATLGETPKSGGSLTYMIPADAPPSLDGHRETTYATVHSAAPFYSTLIRVDPSNPSSTTDFVCDLCTAMPRPTDDGKTYTFKIRDGVKFHDGSPLTSADVKASWDHIIFPPDGVLSVRQSWYMMVDKVEAPDPSTVVFRLKFATGAFLPALADPLADHHHRADQRRLADQPPGQRPGVPAAHRQSGPRSCQGRPSTRSRRRHQRARQRTQPGRGASPSHRSSADSRPCSTLPRISRSEAATAGPRT